MKAEDVDLEFVRQTSGIDLKNRVMGMIRNPYRTKVASNGRSVVVPPNKPRKCFICGHTLSGTTGARTCHSCQEKMAKFGRLASVAPAPDPHAIMCGR